MSTKSCFIPWSTLRNPVLEYPDWSIKDYACVYREGMFYLFFSAFYEEGGATPSHVIEVSTPDFRTYSDPILHLGVEGGWLGMASPDVVAHEGRYFLTLNTWGDKPGRPNQLFYMVSGDLVHWGPRQPLAANLTAGDRSIDAALAFAGGRCYVAWKDSRHVTRIAGAGAPDADFAYVGDGVVSFRTAEGVETSRRHENYQFIRMDGGGYGVPPVRVQTERGEEGGHRPDADARVPPVRLLATYYGAAHRPYLYEMDGDGSAEAHWARWVGGHELAVDEEGFNTEDRSNAAALYDWRAHDGYFYLLYAGNTEKRTYRSSGGWGRGWNRLGLSRSRDLIHWEPAGTENPAKVRKPLQG